MIRVVLRHIDDAEGALIGDFEPEQIDALIDLFRAHDVYVGDHEDCQLYAQDSPTQWVTTNETRPHAVFEILVVSNASV